MPLHLIPSDVSIELKRFRSVLFVACPVCPPISLATEKHSPFIELFKNGLKTSAFEDYVRSLRDPLEQRDVRTGYFTMYAPLPTMCLWTKGQQRRLLKRARDYEAVVVLGCETATATAKQALKDLQCEVIQGMRYVGLTNATAKFGLPMTITLEDVTLVGSDREADCNERGNP